MTPRARAARRRWRRWVLAAVVAITLLPLAYGCTSTITPPAKPVEPTTVYLLREAMHTGLVFAPAPGGTEYVEFGYGDWSWFALARDA